MASVYSSPSVVDGLVYVFGGAESTNQVFAFGLGANQYLRVEPSPSPVKQGELLTYGLSGLKPGSGRR
jgi:hypothetical protein